MLLAVLFAAALASDPTPPAAPPTTTATTVNSPYKNPAIQATATGDANKVVCKTEETTGSRLGAMRVCKTKAQWDATSDASRQMLDDTQQRAFTH